jgi:hypothetical protein
MKARAPDKRKMRSARSASAHQYARRRGENLRNPNSRRNLTCSALLAGSSPCLRSSLPRALRVPPSPARAAMPAWAQAALVLASPSPATVSSTTSTFGVRPLVAVESGRFFCKVASPFLCLPFTILVR